jgi:DMSO/TMAO reductase YedYZ molybdopterin-dependent catalytic subunit
METQGVSRRTALKGAGAAAAGLTVVRLAGPTPAFPTQQTEEVVPWLDQPAPNPEPQVIVRQLAWERLTRIIPNDEFFVINHYGVPATSAAGWRLRVGGLVARPQTLGLAALRARPRREVEFTMECSGNSGFPFFTGGVGNARWAGTPLAPLLRRSGISPRAAEVVFWGADSGTVDVRDNPGIVSAGRTGRTEPDATGGLDLTITEHFARSMSVEDALQPANLLCYEMNGEPLPAEHGRPVRLIAPGWYGVANVKWLTRIEVLEHRFQGRFMARDYVTVRERQRGGATQWTFTSVGHDRLKSAPAKVTRRAGRYTVMGAAWGARIAAVEVRIDDGPWRETRLVGARGARARRPYAWSLWTFDWGRPSAGEHTISSRAIDVDGNRQPAADDPFLASKRTYWESNGRITRRVAIPGA